MSDMLPYVDNLKLWGVTLLDLECEIDARLSDNSVIDELSVYDEDELQEMHNQWEDGNMTED